MLLWNLRLMINYHYYMIDNIFKDISKLNLLINPFSHSVSNMLYFINSKSSQE